MVVYFTYFSPPDDPFTDAIVNGEVRVSGHDGMIPWTATLPYDSTPAEFSAAIKAAASAAVVAEQLVVPNDIVLFAGPVAL